MEISKENALAISDRTGLKSNNSGLSTTSKKFTALSDVRNTVHAKSAPEHSFKQLLNANETDRELRTPSPRRKQILELKFTEQEHIDDFQFTSCRCCFKEDELECEDAFFPVEVCLTDNDINNLGKIWCGQGGHCKEDMTFSPMMMKKNIDWDTLIEKPDLELSFDDSGIDLELDDMFL